MTGQKAFPDIIRGHTQYRLPIGPIGGGGGGSGGTDYSDEDGTGSTFSESDVYVDSCVETAGTVVEGTAGTIGVTVRNDNDSYAAFDVVATADGIGIGQGAGNVPPNSDTVIDLTVLYPNDTGTYQIEATVTGATESVSGL
jgi:hypothetical protein